MKNFGFGCMRLPMADGKIDINQLKQMVDLFLENGFTYFDTAVVYHRGESEKAMKECLVDRYPREKFVFADKLSPIFEKEEEILPIFNKQLESTGLEYFDYYLMHALNRNSYQKYVNCHAFEIGKKLKEEGKIKHLGMSFHDSPEILDKILTEQPDVEFVQIQFNYLDYEFENVQSKRCYEVARAHNKPLIIMEPVKGGTLVNLPISANKLLDEIRNYSNAGYAIRFAASFEGVFMVLSGMSSLEQVKDNVATMKNFVPLNEKEYETVYKVADIIKKENSIPCTGCKYCVDGCPKHIAIPEIFKQLNLKKVYDDWKSYKVYESLTDNGNKASDCIKCGKCEKSCPQHLNIRDLLVEAANTFEKK